MHVVIVGAGPAGLSAAETMRKHDRSSTITLLSAEPYAPYSPPALADHFLSGRDSTLYWKGRDVCERLGLQYRAGERVSGLDPKARQVLLADGSQLAYDRLVIASGSRLYAPVPGAELDGIANFKSLSAASALVERVRSGQIHSALVVGAGFIGVEVALLLADLGVQVTLVEAESHVMPSVLDPETAGVVQREIRRRGVELRADTRVAVFDGQRRVERVRLASGHEVTADAYVAATGVKPNIEWLAGSGVDTRWGVVVDDGMRTNVADVYAAGDVAETRDRFSGEHYVHAIFPNAVEQGRLVGLALSGHEVRYAGAESMNSLKHVGVPVMAVGEKQGDEELTYRYGHALRKLYLGGGRIVGFRLSGDVSSAGVYRSLMLKGANVTRFHDHLAEPGFGMASIALPLPV